MSVLAPSVMATANFPALERAALQVRSPERAVLLAAVMAGTRIVTVGERGIVLLSDDSGAHWRQAKGVPVSVTLTAVRFIDAKLGWAVGHGGVILHSGDGGETWARQADGRVLAKVALDAAQQRVRLAPNDAEAVRQLKAAQLLAGDGPDKPLLDLHFSNASHGFVVGAYNLFFETADGGATWTSAMDRLQNPKSLHLYAIRAHGAAIYVAGEQGLMLGSQDAGLSFQPLASPYNGSWFCLVAMSDGALMAAGLRGNAFYSPDRGRTWARIEGAAQASFVSAAHMAEGTVLLTNQAGQLFTSRSGAALSNLGVPSMPPLSDVLPLPDGGLIAVGMAGAIHLPPLGKATSEAKQ
ncbi:MAG: YCF48-related protein [Rhodoferax sp.]